MVTQLEIAISQVIIGFICFQIGMIVEHWINEKRWKQWKKEKPFADMAFWDPYREAEE